MKKFYSMISMNPGVLKEKSKASKSFRDKFYYWMCIAIRATLVVCLAVLLVTLATSAFGEENSAFAIVFFVIMLMVRFIGFGYRLSDSLVNLAILTAILVFMPSLAVSLPAVAAFLVNFISLLVIICITCQVPQFGFGGFFGFAYSYLVGNAVQGEVLVQRAELAVVCFIVIAAIMIHKHRHDNSDVHFLNLLKNTKLKSLTSMWAIRLALGVSIILTLGCALGIDRFMWLAFACSTVLNPYPYSKDTQTRMGQRIEGIAIGSVGFIILCNIIPESAYSLIGIIGGVFLGFCEDYRWKTIIICFLALSTAEALFGVEGAALLRICNNIIGAVFGMAFALLYDRLIVKNVVKEQDR